LGVSRQPVLQALLLLEREGFARRAARRGMVVAPIDPTFVRDLYAVRGALDALAAREAAARRPQLSEAAALVDAG
ncbi:GntR family transcriptional regulator, partial [Salmonella enterica subsp. enterica serovar Minnesota]